jgi:hypothetical protein
MKVMVQNKVAITNEGGQQEICWNQGALVCAFGKGKFASKASPDDFDPEKEIMFTVKDGTDPILFNGILTTVGDVLAKRRQTHNNAVVNYHDFHEPAPGKFTFEQKHFVVFKPQGSQVAEAGGENDSGENDGTAMPSLQATAGTMIPITHWITEQTHIVWSTQWKSRGLMPIRPQVVFREAGSLAPGRGFELRPL